MDMKLTPLTKEQQALCVQWRPLAIRYAHLSMRKHGVGLHSDEAEGIADEALVSASRVWDPKRGGFPACLKVWVFARVRIYRTHRFQPLSRPKDQWDNVFMYRLNAPAASGDSIGDQVQWQDMLADPNPDRLDDTDARRVARAAEVEIIEALSGRYSTRRKVDSARVSFEVWARKFSDEEVTFEQLGAEYGFSRQSAEQRFKRVQAIFEDWAEGLRAEAA